MKRKTDCNVEHKCLLHGKQNKRQTAIELEVFAAWETKRKAACNKKCLLHGKRNETPTDNVTDNMYRF